MDFFKKIFRRKREKKGEVKPMPLRIEGCKTVLTPKPDESELAAQALLETLADARADSKSDRKEYKNLQSDKRKRKRITNANTHRSRITNPTEPNPTEPNAAEQPRDAAYYKELSEKIKASRAAERRLTMRYLAYCEEQLALPQPLYVGQIGEMEQELYRRQDTVEREGGELLRRWQHCLAEVIVRQMRQAPSP